MKDDALPIIGREYIFKELTSAVYTRQGDAVKAYVVVKYFDDLTGVRQFSQFDLTLKKSENWFIVKG